jgi:predicted alpha/beta superfamily hydrolase
MEYITRRGRREAMKSNRLGFLLLLFSLATGSAVLADTPGPVTMLAHIEVAQIAIPNTKRLEFVSKINGNRYSLSVALPYESAPASGYGVLYLLDSDFYFASATELVRGIGNVPNVVVVGIGYPIDAAFSHWVIARRGPVPGFLRNSPPSTIAAFLERTYDLTLPASDRALAAQALPGSPKQKSSNVGGLTDFLKIIEAEVKPRVASLVHVDLANQTLFGHSFGGLAALHALFIEPQAFRTFIIASPSIWWNDRAVLADEASFAAKVSAGRTSPRVLITVGSEERTPPNFPASWGIDPTAGTAFYRMIRMFENTGELAERLKALHGSRDYKVEDAIFDKENHSVTAWAALARGVPFAFDQ